MKNNIIGIFGNGGGCVSVRQGFFKGRVITYLGGNSFGSHLGKTLKHLINVLAVSEVIYAVFHKTPEEVRAEAMDAGRRQQKNKLREVVC
ncbi:MAG: hypothetical protein LBD34_00220 [Puniceicoccales bacterium]|nr:hypothetical protein [Puniceicoccales bacterium]